MGKEVKKTKQAGPKQKRNRVIVVILLIILVILGIILYMLLRPKGADETVVTKDNVKAIQEEIDKGPSPDSEYTVEMNSNWDVNSATSKTDNAYVKNAEDNQRTVFFDVALADTGESLYKSDYLKVGESVEGFTLDKKLEPGTYKATLTYHLVDDNKEEITTTAVFVTLNVS